MKQLAIFDYLRQFAGRFGWHSNRPTADVVIYTRHGCHLCEEAEQLIRSHGMEPRMIDIDCDEDLRERFDCCVPVVEIDGKIRFRGQVNKVLLTRFMSNSPARADR